MTNQQILTKAIQKAIDGGWKIPSLLKALYANPSAPFYSLEGQHAEMIRGMITSHDFAKALWGEGRHGDDGAKWKAADNCSRCGMIDGSSGAWSAYCWQYHLQQMVIADDPIRYLGSTYRDSW